MPTRVRSTGNGEGYALIGLAIVVFAVLYWIGKVDAGQLVIFAVLVPSIILHEIAHGWVALSFGDDTAKRAGRLTLNPAAHIDPVGTILVPAIFILAGVGFIGWAKPVPVQPMNLRNMRVSRLLVSLGGPATNVVLAVASGVIFKLSGGGNHFITVFLARPSLYYVLFIFGIVNLWLAVFNMLPIPPLDGSSLIEFFLPRKYWYQYIQFRRYSMPFLIIVLLVFNNMGNHSPLVYLSNHLDTWWFHAIS